MNIIFLDIDGVLNTGRSQDIQEQIVGKSCFSHQFCFDEKCMSNLKDIIYRFNAYVVISSSWRIEKDEIYWVKILENFRKYNIENRIIDKTPSFSTFRGNEIKKWIKDNKNKVTNFIILDDEDDMLDLEDYLILCDDYYGFDNSKKNIAINKFKEK